MIDSNYIQLPGKEKRPWNERLLPGINRTLIQDENEVRKNNITKFKEDCNQRGIELVVRERCCCGSTDMELISSIDRFGMEFSCHICRACGLMLTSPCISPESLETYYKKYYHKIHFGRDDLDASKALFRLGQGEKIFKLLKELLADYAKLKVLEIGFGTGNVLMEFKNSAAEAHVIVEELGTEFSMDCIRKARQIGLNVMEGSLREVRSQNIKFDLVILSHVFEHFIDLDGELEHLKHILNIDGLVYVEVPGVLTLHKKGEYAFDFLKYFTHAHIYHFNLTSLTRVFNQNGFMLIRGNEEVEAVFKRGDQQVDIVSNYNNMINYLTLLENIRKDVSELHERLLQTETNLKENQSILKAKELMLLRQHDRLQAIQNTWSWKLTAPLRKLSSRLISKT